MKRTIKILAWVPLIGVVFELYHALKWEPYLSSCEDDGWSLARYMLSGFMHAATGFALIVYLARQ
jgi:hypothetical protein